MSQYTITLTHVCRAWREIFISRPSLWTDLCWRGAGKTQAYLERSKSSPVNVSLCQFEELPPCHPFFQIIPHTIGRLKSVTLRGFPGYSNDIAGLLSNPEPLLRRLEIEGFPTPLPRLFAGDLPLLHDLKLCRVHIELPWGNMAGLTSVDLQEVSPKVSITQLLDCFEGAPRLHTIKLIDTTSTSGGQDSRLVPLASLKWMKISGQTPSAPLLDHLSIPVGAKLEILSESLEPSYENLFPRSPHNLRNVSNFTSANIQFGTELSVAKFTGPNGELFVTSKSPQADITMVLDYLVRLGPSTTKRLTVYDGGSPVADVVHRVLLLMQELRALTIYRCERQYTFVRFLSPQPQPSGVVVCPKLKELVIGFRSNETKPAIQNVIRMAAARASREAKLKTIRIVKDRSRFDQEDVSELKKHVRHLEFRDHPPRNGY